MPFCVQSDGLRAELRIGIPGDHRCILNDDRLFRILKHLLKAGDPDPNYDPVIDFVVVTRFDSETIGGREDVAIESDWEVVYGDYCVSLQKSQESVVTTTKGTKDVAIVVSMGSGSESEVVETSSFSLPTSDVISKHWY